MNETGWFAHSEKELYAGLDKTLYAWKGRSLRVSIINTLIYSSEHGKTASSEHIERCAQFSWTDSLYTGPLL